MHEQTQKVFIGIQDLSSDPFNSLEGEQANEGKEIELNVPHELKNIFRSAIRLESPSGSDMKEALDTQEAEGNACGYCSCERVKELIRNVLSAGYYKRIENVVAITFMVACFMWDPFQNPHLVAASNYIHLNCQIFFSITLVLRLVNWENESIPWIIFESLTTVIGFIALGVSEPVIRYFKAASILKLLIFYRMIPCLESAWDNLILCLSNVKKILFPALLLIYIFALLGMYSFSTYQFNRCRTPDNELKTANWTVYDEEIFLCGERECPIVNGIQLKCLNPIDYGVEPNQDELMNMRLGNGLLRYHNILSALVSTYKQIFITGSSRLIINFKTATYQAYVMVYYLSFIYLLSYVYLNIFYGLMLVNEGTFEVCCTANPTCALKPASQIKAIVGQLDIIQNIENSQQITPVTDDVTPKKIKLKRKRRLNSRIPFAKQTEDENPVFDSPLNFSDILNMDSVGDGLPIKQLEPVVLSKKKPKTNSNFDSLFKQIQNESQEADSIVDDGRETNGGEEVESTFNFDDCAKVIINISNFFVIVGCVNMCIEFESKSEQFTVLTDTIDFIYYLIFMVDVIIKAVLYFRTQETDFGQQLILEILIAIPCTIGIVSEAIIATSVKDFLIAHYTYERVIRSLKYLRIFTFLLSNPFLNEAKKILLSVLSVIAKIRTFILLWMFSVLVFALAGFHMFSYRTKVDPSGILDLQNGGSFPISFDGIYNSVIFVLMTFYNEQWDYIMFQQFLGSSFLIVVWQIFSMTFGYLILSKYFMTLMMKELSDKLDQETDKHKDEQERQDTLKQISFQNLFGGDDDEDSDDNSQELDSNLGITQVVPMEPAKKKVSTLFRVQGEDCKARKNSSQAEVAFFQKDDGVNNSMEKACQNKIQKQVLFNIENLETLSQKYKCVIMKQNNCEEMVKEGESEPGQLYIVFERMTEIIRKVMDSGSYTMFRCFMVGILCVHLVLDNPQVDPDSSLSRTIFILNQTTIVFFLVEIIVSLLLHGLIIEKTSYLRRGGFNGANIIISIIEILGYTSLGGLTWFQLLTKVKVLRVMSLIELRFNNDKNMRLTLVGFAKLIPKVLNFLLVTLMILGFFSVLLIRLYKDDFYHCVNSSANIQILTQHDCYSWGGDWIQYPMNVSNFGQALLYLMLIAATEGWSVLMITSASLRGADLQPLSGSKPVIMIFFMGFFFLGNLIMVNVFIGLSIYNFKKIKEETTGQNQLLPKERMWLGIKSQIYRMQPVVLDKAPQNVIRRYCHTIAKSTCYKVFRGILFLTLLIILSTYHYSSQFDISSYLNKVIHLYVVLVIPEYLIQVLAYGIRKDHKKKFFIETFILLYVIFNIIFFATVSMSKKEERIFRVFGLVCQLFRYFTLLNEFTYVRKLFNSLLTVIPQTSNIIFIMVVTLFVYAIIGVQLFSYLKPNSQLNSYDQNYKTFSSSLFALIKFSLNESPILQISNAAETSGPNFVCFNIQSYQDFQQWGQMGCGGKLQSYSFFLSFHLIYSLILMPTLMAVIFDVYSEVIREEEALVTKFQLQQVSELWKEYDHEATGYISYRDFWMFTAKIMKVYKADHTQIMNESKQSFLKSLAIPIYEHDSGILCFQFHQVIEGLTKIILRRKNGKKFMTSKADMIMKERQSVAKNKLKRSEYDSSHVLTLIILKSGLRVWKKKIHQKNVLTIFSNMRLINKDKKTTILSQCYSDRDKQSVAEPYDFPPKPQ